MMNFLFALFPDIMFRFVWSNGIYLDALHSNLKCFTTMIMSSCSAIWFLQKAFPKIRLRVSSRIF